MPPHSRSSRGDWTGCDELLVARINHEIQPFERARTQEQQVPLFGKDDLVSREVFADPENCEANAAGDLLPVGHYEWQVFLLSYDTNAFEDRLRNPRIFTPRIDQDLWNPILLFPVRMVLNDAMCVERSHRYAKFNMRPRIHAEAQIVPSGAVASHALSFDIQIDIVILLA